MSLHGEELSASGACSKTEAGSCIGLCLAVLLLSSLHTKCYISSNLLHVHSFVLGALNYALLISAYISFITYSSFRYCLSKIYEYFTKKPEEISNEVCYNSFKDHSWTVIVLDRDNCHLSTEKISTNIFLVLNMKLTNIQGNSLNSNVDRKPTRLYRQYAFRIHRNIPFVDNIFVKNYSIVHKPKSCDISRGKASFVYFYRPVSLTAYTLYTKYSSDTIFQIS